MTPMPSPTPPPVATPADPDARQPRLPGMQVATVYCRHCGLPAAPPFGYTHGPTTSHAIHEWCVRPGDTPPFDEARWKAATATRRAGRE